MKRPGGGMSFNYDRNEICEQNLTMMTITLEKLYN